MDKDQIPKRTDSINELTDTSENSGSEQMTHSAHSYFNENPVRHAKKKLIIILLLLFVIVVGGSVTAWVLTIKDTDKKTNKVDQNLTSQDNTHILQKESKVLKPFAVAYSHETHKINESQYSTKAQLYWRPITGGGSTSAAYMGDNNGISYYGVYKDKVFAVSVPNYSSADGTALWYSSDAGKTYTKIFSGQALSGVRTGDQITSAKFSSDGKTILIGVLPSDRSQNTVKEINPETKAVNDLFSVKDAGVFILGYDRAGQQVLYRTGCYNCDGFAAMNIFVHDLTSGTDTVLFEDKKYNYGYSANDSIVPKDDFGKILIVKYAIDYSTPTYFLPNLITHSIEEFDMTTKTFKNVLTIDEDTPVNVGYIEGGGVIYYSKADSIYSISPSGDTTLIFKADKPIHDVFFVDKDQVIASIGEYNNYSVVNYKISTKSTVEIIGSDNYTNIFGVTWD